MAGHEISFVDNSSSMTYNLAHYNMLERIKKLVEASTEGWDVLRYDTSTENHELILKGEGFTGTEEIFVGFRTYQSADADYYNLVAGTFTGFVSGNSFDNQPGAILSGVPAHNNYIDYWITWNAQRIALAMKVGTPVYESCYVGKFLPYAFPSQFPYPVVCIGMLDGTPATRFSDTSHAMGYRGDRNNMRMRDTDGTWQTPSCYPFSDETISGPLRDTNNYYHLMPIEVFNSANIYGSLDGVFFISGFNNSVENTLSIDGVDYVVIQDVFRTGFNSYYALRLDA